MVLRTAAVLAVVAVLTGCTAQPPPGPALGPTLSIADRCGAAAEAVVSAAALVVEQYAEVAPEGPPADAEASRSTAASAPAAAGPSADEELATAVAGAVAERDRLGCDPVRFRGDIEDGLATIETDDPIADAVRRRTTASILGTARQEAGEWALQPGDDLRDAVATAAAGTSIVLPAGTWELDGTLVLLDGIALRGAGRDATTLRSTAADAAVLVVTAGVVRLEELTIALSGSEPASGLVAGPSASVVLTSVRITGAVSGAAGEGGAGVFLSAQGAEGSGRGTTLEVTDSVFEGNDWAGIALAGGHRASIESTTFTANGEAGAIFLDASSGSVRGSTFADNPVGLAATGTATPVWLDTTVTGGEVGLQITGSAAPAIDGVQMTDVSSAGVIYGDAATGRIDRATCIGVPYGLVVSDGAAPTLGELDCEVARGLP